MKGETHYEYRFEDRSIVLQAIEAPVLVPIARALPRSLTPNQITIAGQTAAFTAFALASWITPMTAGGFVAIAAAVSFFVFADSIDGLFARQTKRTSRLGEFLDHWLDALSVPLVVFTFAVVLQTPAQLALLSAIVCGFLHYTTMLHGFRVGYVHLGAIGVVEGTVAGAAACMTAAIFGPEIFTRPVLADFSLGAVLLCTLIAGAGLALGPMRRVFARFADFAAIAILLGALWAWFTWGRVPLGLVGFLTVAITAAFEGRVLRARLLRQPLELDDWTLFGLVLGGMALSLALDLSTPAQTLAAGIATLYVLGRNAAMFAQMVRALRTPVLPSATPGTAATSSAPHP